MKDKYELFSHENEKNSDAECQNFLQLNYNPIAQRLNNFEYDSLESLNFEILGFLNYFVEEGPKGPNSQTIAQRFCYDRLAEGSNFFNEKINQQLNVNTQLAEQAINKLKTDLNEVKDEKRKESETIQSKLRQAETQRAELAAREETTRESLAQALKARERLELETEEKMLMMKRDAQRGLSEMTDQVNAKHEEMTKMARTLKA